MRAGLGAMIQYPDIGVHWCGLYREDGVHLSELSGSAKIEMG